MYISGLKNALKNYRVIIFFMFAWIVLLVGTLVSNIVPVAKKAEKVLAYASPTITNAVGPIHNDSTLIQNFTVQEKMELSEIAFTVGTYGERGYEAGKLRIQILDKDGGAIISGEYELPDAADGFPWSMTFGQNIELEKGQYYIEITPFEFEKPLAFFTTEKEEDFLGQLLWDGQAQEFPLYIYAYCEENNSFLYGYFAFYAFFALLIFGMGSWFILKGQKLENVYVFLATSLGILFMFIYPVYSYNDETSHVSSVLHYLGDIWPVKASVQEINTDMEETFLIRYCELYENTGFTYHMPGINQYRYIYNHLFEIESDPNYIVSSAKAVGVFYEYIPQILGVALARIFHLGSVATLFLAQLLALFFSVYVFRLAIKITPFKELFASIALIPVIVKVNGSFSYDLFLNAVIILILAIICDCIWGKRLFTNRTIIGLMILSILALPPKVVYFPLIALIMLIPKEKVKSKLSPKWVCGIIACGIVLVIGIQSLEVITGKLDMDVAEALGPWGNKVYTYGSLLKDPLEFIRLYFNSLVNELPTMFFYAVGLYQHINLPMVVTVAIYVTIYRASLNGCQFTITQKQKAVIMSVIVPIILMLYFVAISWTTIGNYLIMGMQGRYLQPLFPLFFILLMPSSCIEKIRPISQKYMLFFMMNINLFSMLHIFRQIIR